MIGPCCLACSCVFHGAGMLGRLIWKQLSRPDLKFLQVKRMSLQEPSNRYWNAIGAHAEAACFPRSCILRTSTRML